MEIFFFQSSNKIIAKASQKPNKNFHIISLIEKNNQMNPLFLQETMPSDFSQQQPDPILNITNLTGEDIQIVPYVSTEYFYNLLPCYIFIVTALYRYISIYRQPSFRDKVQAQQDTQLADKTTEGRESETKNKIIVTNYQSDLEQLEERTASYYIKTRFSFANSILYIISVIFAFVMPSSLFSAAIKPTEGLLYLIGMLAWYLSGKLIKVEFEKGLNQEIYTHRLFWVFTGSLAFIRIFQRSEVFL